MKLLQAKKMAEYRAALELIQRSSATAGERFGFLCSFFYKLVRSATNEDKVVFRNFYARFKYLLSQLNLSAAGRQNFDAFRRFIKDGSVKKVSDESIRQALALLGRVLNQLSEAPMKGKQAFEAIPYDEKHFSALYPRRNYSALKTIKVLCASWTELSGEPENVSFTLTAFDLENLEGQVDIVIRKHAYADFTTIRRLLTDNAILQLIKLDFTGSAKIQYSTTEQSLITLEPDFLVDASSIGECFNGNSSNSDIFLLSRLVADLPGAAALKGSIVGYYLDEMVRNQSLDTDAAFTAAQLNYALKAAQLGRSEMQNVKRSVQEEHLPNVRALVRQQGDKDLWIEPTYFSREYGLQGRIDLLGIDKKLGLKNIVELKSGSPSNPVNSDAWAGHRMQVVCYDMLLESTYGENRRGSNTVFYSKCTISPWRSIVSEHREKVSVLNRRNEIVASLYKLANGDTSPLQRIKDRGVPGIPGFSLDKLEAFRQWYAPDRIATQYYQELLAFILRELINTKVGDLLKEEEEDRQNGFAGLWLDDISSKEGSFEVIYDLQVQDIDPAAAHIRLQFTTPLHHAFRKGDLVILYPKTANGYRALTQHILKGTIREMKEENLTISLFNKQTDYNFINEHEHWCIEPDIFERNYWTAISGLFNILSCSDQKKRLLFGHAAPQFNDTAIYHHPGLTENQNNAVRQALDAKDYYLLQGPPGTGKTSTFLVNYIRALTERTTDKIVVLAFTNKAVDKICESFAEPRNGEAPIRYMRLGSLYVEDNHLFANQLKGNNPDDWRKMVDGHRVFVATVATFQNNWLLLKKFISFESLVIDEASQLTEAAVAGILALFNKFVLIGDHKQLPSVITQEERTCLTQRDYLNKLGIFDFRISLFERLMTTAKKREWKNAYGQLTHHYRMHDHIAGLIALHYDEKLVPGKPEQESEQPPYTLPDSHALYPLTQSRVVFIESAPGDALKSNAQEACLAAAIASMLIGEGIVTPGQIGIITPFRAQIAEIKKHLPEAILTNSDFIIDTVERYQGDERKIIIFSTTISHPRQTAALQSIASNDAAGTDRKLLVSISRASDQLVILGNAEALGAAAAYSDAIRQIKSRDGFLGKDFSKSIVQLHLS